jgi:pilus assembly protein CpaF
VTGAAELVAAEGRVRARFLAGDGAGDAVATLAELLAEEAPLLGPEDLRARARSLAADLVGLGPLQALLEDPAVSDVMVNGPGPVWVERSGRLERTAVEVARDAIERYVERLVGPLGLRADRTNPIVDARLADGTRVGVVLPPIAVDGPVLAIRRHQRRSLPLSAFASEPVAQLLAELVARRCNLAVYGATGAGKTTLLNALLALVDPSERLVTIEDVAELRPPGEHVVRLEARPGTADGVGRAKLRDLVRVALRLRPDRIVVGEVRGAEANDMVWALSTGHDGSFATWHAASAQDALVRLETLCALGAGNVSERAIRAQIHAAIDVLVGVARRPDGRRVVHSVHGLDRRGELRALVHPTADPG